MEKNLLAVKKGSTSSTSWQLQKQQTSDLWVNDLLKTASPTAAD